MNFIDFKSKTFWTAIATIVTAAGGYAQGLMALPDSIEMIAIALIGLFLRHTVAKGQE